VLSGRDAETPGARPAVWYPRAVGELRWSEMDGAFLLSRPDGDHVLNQTGVLLLELANGRHTVDEMIGIVQQAFALDRPPEDDVRDFLERAVAAGLVE
jgi:hypothetical protein